MYLGQHARARHRLLQRLRVARARAGIVQEIQKLQQHLLGVAVPTQADVQLGELHLHLRRRGVVGARRLEVRHGAREVVCNDERTTNLGRETDVARGLLCGALVRLDRKVGFANCHVRLAQRDVRLGVAHLRRQVLITLDVRRLVVALLEVDLGQRHLGARVVRGVRGHAYEHLKRAVGIPPYQRQVAVGNHHAHLLGGALKLRHGGLHRGVCLGGALQPPQHLRVHEEHRSTVAGGDGQRLLLARCLRLLRCHGRPDARDLHRCLELL
mmetsp:Transcript_16041/g.39440  ORF Transcript_16041/g.39440 Transcript_16041/m.39440 type:complete len:269 (+) Transcript_16041:1427-2233(+)